MFCWSSVSTQRNVLIISTDVAAQSTFVEHEASGLAAALAPLGSLGTVGMHILASAVVGNGV